MKIKTLAISLTISTMVMLGMSGVVSAHYMVGIKV